MRQSKTIFIIIILFFTTMINYAQDIFIQGGGTLKDWAHLKKFEKENETLKKVNNYERVVFMGNSITEGWSHFRPEFFESSCLCSVSRKRASKAFWRKVCCLALKIHQTTASRLRRSAVSQVRLGHQR